MGKRRSERKTLIFPSHPHGQYPHMDNPYVANKRILYCPYRLKKQTDGIIRRSRSATLPYANKSILREIAA